MMDVDEAVTLMSALRYCLGRSSYAPGCVMDHIRKAKGRISPADRGVMIREIEQYLQENTRDIYEESWTRLVKDLSG